MLMSVFDVHVPDMYVIGFHPDEADVGSAVGQASNVAPSTNASAFVAARLVTCVPTSPVSGS